jgi:hypothetical protein
MVPPPSLVDALRDGSLTIATMSNKPKNSKPTRCAPLTRAQPLPIEPATARVFSLRYHLALVAMRDGRGDAYLASELVKTPLPDLLRLREGSA